MSNLTQVLADFLSGTAVRTFTCQELADAAGRKLGHQPSLMAVSRIVGQRTDWRKIRIDGKVAFTRDAPHR